MFENPRFLYRVVNILVLLSPMVITGTADAQEIERKLILVARPQDNLTAENPMDTVNTVFWDQSTQTIDFFFEAWDGNRQFWDFDEKNLVVREKIGKVTLDLEVIFQGKIKDRLHFGDREVYQLKTRSKENYHRGVRTYVLIWQSPDSRLEVAKVQVEKNWGILGAFSQVRKYSFADLLVICLLILAVTLLVLSEVVPWIHILNFKKKYVFSYSEVQRQGERKFNPVSGMPLKPNERVVKMCNRDICEVPLHIWERRNYQCLYCPDRCDGNANIWTREFFSQRGSAKKLNWLWFGAAGGAMAWILNYLLELFPQEASREWLSQILLGFSTGLSYALMLSWVEELGQSRNLSILRILLRAFIGGVAGAALFFGFAYLGHSGLLSALTWLLFCAILGLVLSINSSIPWIRGGLSGLAAGVVSGAVYYALPLLFSNPEASLVKMITLIVAGAVLGQGIIQVVKQLDKIELQVVAPQYRSGLVFSLDNFLKTGNNVVIGKEMKTCTVRVKWEDEMVLGQHAQMKMSDNKVFIQPLGEAELWINDNRLTRGQSLLLRGGEMIHLGRNNKTVFKYLQKA